VVGAFGKHGAAELNVEFVEAVEMFVSPELLEHSLSLRLIELEGCPASS
jgi:hypothetical protein